MKKYSIQSLPEITKAILDVKVLWHFASCIWSTSDSKDEAKGISRLLEYYLKRFSDKFDR